MEEAVALFSQNEPVRVRATGESRYIIGLPTFDPREEVLVFRYKVIHFVGETPYVEHYWEDELQPYCS